MTWEISGWVIRYYGCTEKDPDCHMGKFEVFHAEGPAQEVEVLTTMQIEHILAGEMGKQSLSDEERGIILAVAGKQLIEECIERDGQVPTVIYFSGQIFRSEGAERRLLEECGLMPAALEGSC